MKITELNIQGFRSLKNVQWKPGNLNVIIGPNGSGKSNLLRALEMISASARGQLAQSIQEAGGIRSIVWDGEASSILWEMNLLTVPLQNQNFIYKAELARGGGEYSVHDEALSHSNIDSVGLDEQPIWNNPLRRHGTRAYIVDDDDKQSDRRVEDEEVQETELSYFSSPITKNIKLRYFRSNVIGWAIYQDLPLGVNSQARMPPLSRLEQRVSPDAHNLINVLHTLYSSDREFKRQVNSSMRAAFGDDFDELIFPPASDQRIQLRVRWKTLKREQSAADLSDGTLRFLFLLAVLASPNPAPLIAIDEPETGLHPSMLPLIAELAVDAAERTQVVFTTHSDQFLDAFRETGIRPTTTVAKWENGETTLTTLADDELEYWLQNYSLGHLFRSGELENLAS
jgi:predicted ATPase